MQLTTCAECVNREKKCNFLLLEAYAAVKNIEYFLHRSIQYSMQENRENINIKFDFECNGFIPRKKEGENKNESFN